MAGVELRMMSSAASAEEALLASALLGGGLPLQAENHLQLAGLFYHRDDVAERHLREAQVIAPDHAAVLIGLYRYYFYKGRLAEASEIARICLDKAARDNRLAADWRQVRAGDAEFSDLRAILPRFYLFSLKAYAYLQMRLGALAEGETAARKLMELDPGNLLGGRVLLEVLARMGADDDD